MAVYQRPPAPKVKLGASVFFLLVGLYPLWMLIRFWLASGTGMHLGVWGFMGLWAASFLVALNYLLFYREAKPRAALIPPGFGQALLVALVLVPVGAYNLLGVASGWNLTLSPGPLVPSSEWGAIAAKLLLHEPLALPPARALDLVTHPWLVSEPYLRGSLWGALGYAVPFGVAAALFGMLRREKTDPRDATLGTGMLAAFTRGAVGLYYGATMGFLVGAVVVGALRALFWNFASAPPVVLNWIYALGAASNPNVAFGYAFPTACFLAAATALFLGRRDFTSPVSDPKAVELTRPVQVVIPAVPPVPEAPFDARGMQAESQQILSRFDGEVERIVTGPEWHYERYDLPVVGKPKADAAEPAIANVLSARQGDESAGYGSAMGSLSNVYVQITAELGALEISASEWLSLGEGAMLELPRRPDGAVAVRINGQIAGQAKPLTVDGYKAVKMTQLRAPIEQLTGGVG